MPMQPRPRAETVRPLRPRRRVCMHQLVAPNAPGVAPPCTVRSTPRGTRGPIASAPESPFVPPLAGRVEALTLRRRGRRRPRILLDVVVRDQLAERPIDLDARAARRAGRSFL